MRFDAELREWDSFFLGYNSMHLKILLKVKILTLVSWIRLNNRYAYGIQYLSLPSFVYFRFGIKKYEHDR